MEHRFHRILKISQMDVPTGIKYQYYRQHLESGIRKIFDRQRSIASTYAASDSRQKGRGAAIAAALRDISYKISPNGPGAELDVSYPLQLRFMDMKRIGNWKIYNKVVWPIIYKETLQDIKYEFRQWLRKNHPEIPEMEK